MANELTTFEFDAENRRPWNNKIYPGNYVAQLNAYRDQGVVALPGAVFFRGVGALVLNPDNDGNLTDGVLAAGTHDLQVLSPDMRQDDKPRKDRPFVIPAGAVVYRTAVSAPGVCRWGACSRSRLWEALSFRLLAFGIRTALRLERKTL